MWIRSISGTEWAPDDAPQIPGAMIAGRVRLLLGSGRIVPGLLLERRADGRREFFALYLVPETGTFATQAVDDLRSSRK